MDQPPTNRATRRARNHPKGEAVLLRRQSADPNSLSVKRQQQSQRQRQQSMPLDLPTGISNGFSAIDHDIPPDNYMNGQTSMDDGASPPEFKGYRGKYGLLKTNIVTSYATVGMVLGGPGSPDGLLFLSSSESIADAWIAWGKTNPQYMRLVNILWGGAFMTLILAHAPLAAGLMANHGVRIPSLLNPLQMPMFKASLGSAAPTGSQAPLPATGTELPFTYQPVGAQAPTDDLGPPPSPDLDAPLRVYPDEGIPSDVETQLRMLSQQTGVPYNQIRDQYLLETAQDRIAHNQKINAPGSLGMPVTQPGA